MDKKPLHNPLSGILDRERAIEEFQQLIDKYCPYLVDVINFSTNLLARCEKSLSNIEGAPTSLIHLYYHCIQMTDGIEVLARNAAFVAAAPLHRSLMEASTSIDFMLEDDFEVRSISWLVASFLERKSSLEACDPTTQRGQEFRRKMASDKIFDKDFELKVDEKLLRRQIEQFDRQLAKPRFARVSRK